MNILLINDLILIYITLLHITCYILIVILVIFNIDILFIHFILILICIVNVILNEYI